MLDKVFYSEPKADDNSAITVVGESMFHKIMCAPKTATKQSVENAAGPSGTSHGWQVDETRSDYCVECQDDPTRQHWLLFC